MDVRTKVLGQALQGRLRSGANLAGARLIDEALSARVALGQQRVADLVSPSAGAVRSLAADLESTAERLAVLNADYEASNEEFMAAYGDYEARRKAALMRLRKRIFAIRKEVSAEEWKAIVK